MGHCSFFGYRFIVQGVNYIGRFAVLAKEVRAGELQTKLTGRSIDIRYNPSDPNVSVVAELHDPLFDGLSATQNPDRLNQAPLFQITAKTEK